MEEAVSPASEPGRIRSVAMVTPGWPPSAFVNGIVTYVALMREALADRGVTVTLLAQRLGGSRIDPGVIDLHERARRLSFTRLRDAVSWRLDPEGFPERRIERALRDVLPRLRAGADLQLLEMEETLGWCDAVSRSADIPVVVRLHGPWCFVGPAMGAARDGAFDRRVERERTGFLSADAISAPSQHVLARLQETYDFAPRIAEIIPNPILPAAAGERWALEHCHRRTILFVGRFDRCKGGDIAIDAFAQVAEHDPDVELVFVGPDRGLTRDDGSVVPFEEYVESRIRRDDVRRRLNWLGWQQPDQISRLRRDAGVTIVPSRYETFAMTALEALAVGSPLIVAGAGGLVDMVNHEQNGLIFESGSAESLAASITRLLDDDALSRRLGDQAFADVTMRYHPALTAERTLAFYDRVVECSRPA